MYRLWANSVGVGFSESVTCQTLVPDLDAFLDTLHIGGCFCWGAFTSTTTDQQVAMGFGGNVVFEIGCNPPEGLYDDDEFEYHLFLQLALSFLAHHDQTFPLHRALDILSLIHI